jgi:hypothetical protein
MSLFSDTAESQTTRDARGLSLGQPPSNFVGTEYSFFQKPAASSSCPPGDFVCLAERSIKTGVRNEMANAVVKSVATVMTEMLNSTLTRSLGDMILSARNSEDPQKAAEARQAMSMVTGALQTVSSKVIQGFAFFVKMSISGVMSDLFNQVMVAAKHSPQAIAEQSHTSTLSTIKVDNPVSLQGNKYFEYNTAGSTLSNADLTGVNPSSIDNNSLKRAAVVSSH